MWVNAKVLNHTEKGIVGSTWIISFQPLAMGMDTLNMFQMLPVDQSNPEGLM